MSEIAIFSLTTGPETHTELAPDSIGYSSPITFVLLPESLGNMTI
jgi:hypothetical protein